MVYVIEDDSGVTRALELFFHTARIPCRFFQTVADCLAFFNTEEHVVSHRPFDPAYDIFMIDFLLPEMNGDKAAKAIKDHFNINALNVILVSAQPKAVIEAQINDKLTYDFLQKPFLLEELEDIVGKKNFESVRRMKR